MKTIELTNNVQTKGDFQRLRCVLACTGKDNERAVLRCVLVEKVKGGVSITATDGVRLRKDLFGLRAAPGLYEIQANTAKVIRLGPCHASMKFPDYRSAVPSYKARDTYTVSGSGSRFVMWIGAALGCYIDPKFVALRDDEKVDIIVQKKESGKAPLIIRNPQTMLVIMPVRLDNDIARQLHQHQRDQLRRRKEPEKKPQPIRKKVTAPWWSFIPAVRKAA